jgi:hypothetical protein
MKYRILSPRVGTPGEIYEPPVWVNLGLLLDGGFIEPADKEKPTPDKPAKAKVSHKKSEPDTETDDQE